MSTGRPGWPRAADALVGFKTQPHTDHYETATLGMDILLRAMRGEIRPVTTHRKIRMLISAERQDTTKPPNKDLMDASPRDGAASGRPRGVDLRDPAVDGPARGRLVGRGRHRRRSGARRGDGGRARAACVVRARGVPGPQDLDRRGAGRGGGQRRAAVRVRRRLRLDDRRRQRRRHRAARCARRAVGRRSRRS